MPIIGLVAAGLGAAGSIASGIIGSQASSHAAETQATAAKDAQNTQLQMYQQTRSDLSPFMTAGSGALSQLANIFGFGPGGTGQPNASAATSQLTQFPGYQFGLDQGVQALDRSAASKGLILSGAQLKDAQQFGTGYAQQQAWAPYISELNSISGQGENAAAGVGSAGVTTGQGVAQSQLAQGQASAAGTVAGANQLTSAISGLTGSGPGSISNLLSSYGGVGGATSQLGGPAASDAGFSALVGL